MASATRRGGGVVPGAAHPGLGLGNRIAAIYLIGLRRTNIGSPLESEQSFAILREQ